LIYVGKNISVENLLSSDFPLHIDNLTYLSMTGMGWGHSWSFRRTYWTALYSSP